MDAEADALPNAVLDEERGDFLDVVVVVADFAVARLEALDRLDVFLKGDARCEFGVIHWLNSLDRDADLAEMGSALEMAIGGGCLCERERTIDNRPHLSGL